MALTGLLILTRPLARVQAQVGNILNTVRNHVRKKLYVQLLPERKNLLVPLPSEPLPSQLGAVVSALYANASVVCNDLDVRVLLEETKKTRSDIQLVVFEEAHGADEMRSYVDCTVSERCQILTLNFNANECSAETVNTASDKSDKIYSCGVLGGTFDRLHNGHKILLSEAAIRCKHELVVGVTDGAMIKSKKIYELIEPCLDRMHHVRNFLEDVRPSLYYRIVPITDPFGPTKDDPDIQLMVVSEETRRGGQKVNEVRLAKGLPLLDVYEISLLQDELRTTDEEEDKVSSSSLRMRLLGQRLRQPEKQPSIPYIIGLTGGIACGKSSIAARIEKLGASVIDCDKLGHSAYEEGTTCHKKIVEEFGRDVVDADGNIVRKVLGEKVFSSPEKMQKLNQIVWPEIARLAKEQIEYHQKMGTRVVLLDAAVLLEAGWEKFCHEVWVTVVPENEAVRRVMERNNLSEDQARRRVSAQLSNEERVAKSHVVFSTLWQPEYTQKQVERAWKMLESHLTNVTK